MCVCTSIYKYMCIPTYTYVNLYRYEDISKEIRSLDVFKVPGCFGFFLAGELGKVAVM